MEMVLRQALRLGGGLLVLLVLAQIPPRSYRFWAPMIYALGVVLLVLVVLIGTEAKGAARWLHIPGWAASSPPRS